MPQVSTLSNPAELFCESIPDVYLFVCTGNTCRSPMAAALFNAFWSRRGVASSAGTAASLRSISENARLALEARGITPTPLNDYTAHISRQVTEGMVRSATRVYGISSRHRDMLISAFPEYAEKIFALPIDITDPYGGDLNTYKACLKDIEAALKAEFGELPGANAPESDVSSDGKPHGHTPSDNEADQ